MNHSDLILLPGTLCDERVFAPALAALELRGTTAAMTGEDNAADMARRILAATPPHFALCGFSLGAIVALEVIAQAPRRVTKLTLVGGNARPMPDDKAAARRQALAVAEIQGTTSYIAANWDASVPRSRHADLGLRAELEAMARSTSLAAFHDQIEMSINRSDLRPVLRTITVPTLILCGAEDRICPPALSLEMAAAIPRARLAVVKNAGHYVTLDQPAIVARELRDWLSIPTETTPVLSKELS